MRSFGSDNHSGVHPKVFETLRLANADHAVAYGADHLTRQVQELVREECGDDTQLLFVYNGTGANVCAIAPFLRSFHGVICSAISHLNADEAGAPETFTGSKLIAVDSRDGKLTPELIEPQLRRFGNQHAVQPRILSLTQSNEYGLVYQPAEVRALTALAHAHGMLVHLDGARLANAAAALGLGLREITRDLGVDIVSLGGTKNGLMFGEAVLMFGRSVEHENAKFFQKNSCQLASKMRFISAQYVAYLTADLWLTNARHANRMAGLFAEALRAVPGANVSRPVETNMVFATLEKELAERLQREYVFYFLDPGVNEARFVTSFDTTEEDIQRFIAKARAG